MSGQPAGKNNVTFLAVGLPIKLLTYLVKKFTGMGSQIFLTSKEKILVEQKLVKGNKDNSFIRQIKGDLSNQHFNYKIFYLDISRRDTNKTIDGFLSYIDSSDAKSVFLVSSSKNKRLPNSFKFLTEKLLGNNKDKKAVVIVDGGINLENNLVKVSNTLIEILFSIKAYGKIVGLFINQKEFNIYEEREHFNFGEAYFLEKKRGRKKNINKIKLSNNASGVSYSTYGKTEKTKINKQLIKKTTRTLRHYSKYIFILLFIVIVLFPYTLNTLSYLAISLGVDAINDANFGKSNVYFTFSDYINKKNINYLDNFQSADATNKIYKGAYRESKTLSQLSTAGRSLTFILNDLVIKNRTRLDGFAASEKYTAALNNLYTQLGFIEAETYSPNEDRLIKTVLPATNISQLRRYIEFAKYILPHLENIFGYDEPKEYVVVVQDTSIPRATGGIITEMFLATASQGELIDLTPVNIADIDNKMEGLTAPPKALREHFEKPSWLLSNANWYIDFPRSAQQTEWFLKNSFGLPVDGVIFINKDYLPFDAGIENNETVNDDLVAQLIKVVKKSVGFQSGDEFNADNVSAVPSSADMSSSLSEGNHTFGEVEDVIESIFGSENKSNTQKIRTLGWLLKGLDVKGVQLYFDDVEVEEVFRKTGFANQIEVSGCGSFCAKDLIAISEDMVDENPQKERTVKKAELTINSEKNIIKKSLTVELLAGDTYKTYLRVFVPEESGISPFEITSGSDKTILTKPEVFSENGYKEAGVLLDITKDVPIKVNISWETSFSNLYSQDKRLDLVWYYQAGYSYPISINFKSDTGGGRIESEYFLTEGESISYNTTLSKNTDIAIFW
ncbi:hypothetical protein A2115_01080 [Candidatus Woesebacteria bacterium GWA1_41_8]|uniref:DUF4012 domain-containing protein n=1 Tax=Candidatus Woesebacteria bacterium GWA1_41_8 TaxID=1802471 RepID=A0A1F7WIG1_9BACT|nr:MAG: hypothetical protein A2115_01080 [Candidatus Woesebacteria bacterium GWA1_41_8]